MKPPGVQYLSFDYKNVGRKIATRGDLWCDLRENLGAFLTNNFKENCDFQLLVGWDAKSTSFEKNVERIKSMFTSYNNVRNPTQSIQFLEFVAHLGLFKYGIDMALKYFTAHKPNVDQDTSMPFCNTRDIRFVTYVIFDLSHEVGGLLADCYNKKLAKTIALPRTTRFRGERRFKS